MCLFSDIILLWGVYRPFWTNFRLLHQLLCLPQARNTGAVDISWLASTAIVSVPGAGKKVRALTLVSPILIVTRVIHLLRNNVSSCPRLLVGSKKKSVTPRRFLTGLQFLSHRPVCSYGSGSSGRPRDCKVPWF